jgi:hypothetical protein
MENYKHSGLFNPGGCITANTFTRYLNNSLRPAEKAIVEDHLRHCLICSEALEGYKRHRNSTFMQSDLEFLSGKIRKRYGSRQINRGLPVYIFISIFVFLILIFIIYFIIRLLITS